MIIRLGTKTGSLAGRKLNSFKSLTFDGSDIYCNFKEGDSQYQWTVVGNESSQWVCDIEIWFDPRGLQRGKSIRFFSASLTRTDIFPTLIKLVLYLSSKKFSRSARNNQK